MKYNLCLLLAVGLISLGCENQPLDQPQAEVRDSAEISRQTEAVLAHHFEAFGKGDVDDVLSDYTKESKLFTPDGVLEGTAAIRPLFEKFSGEVLPPGSEFKITKRIVDGETAYIVWTAESEKVKFVLGTDTFIVRDGKIVTQTFAGHMEAKE